jgi:hypothetical protein
MDGEARVLRDLLRLERAVDRMAVDVLWMLEAAAAAPHETELGLAVELLREKIAALGVEPVVDTAVLAATDRLAEVTPDDLEPRPSPRCCICGGVVESDPSSESAGVATFGIPGLGIGRLHQHVDQTVCIRELRALARMLAERHYPLVPGPDDGRDDIGARLVNMLLHNGSD